MPKPKDREMEIRMKNNSESQRKRNLYGRDGILVLIFSLVLFGLSIFCWIKPEEKFSESERRVMETFPKITLTSVLNGKFMKEFETYSLDQFPFRDSFRRIKAFASYSIFGKKENNGIYLADGYLSKVEYPLEPKMLDYASSHFEKIYHTYLKEKNSKCYFTIVPDKNYFLAKKKGYLAIDYEEMFSYMQEKMHFAEYLDIAHLLSEEDYYKTDTHWRQEKIVDVAEYLKEAMHGEETKYSEEHNLQEEQRKNKKQFMEYSDQKELAQEYRVIELETPFYGVYCGQAALPIKPDTLYYLESETLKNCKVTSFDTGKARETVIYNMKKAAGNDARQDEAGPSDPGGRHSKEMRQYGLADGNIPRVAPLGYLQALLRGSNQP